MPLYRTIRNVLYLVLASICTYNAKTIVITLINSIVDFFILAGSFYTILLCHQNENVSARRRIKWFVCSKYYPPVKFAQYPPNILSELREKIFRCKHNPFEFQLCYFDCLIAYTTISPETHHSSI